jgi:hypothetical protein
MLHHGVASTCILFTYHCNTRSQLNGISHYLLCRLRAVNFPCFSLVFLSGPTCYRATRRGQRLTPSAMNNKHKYLIINRFLHTVCYTIKTKKMHDPPKKETARSFVTSLHGPEPFLRSLQLCSYSRTSEHFMEPESSLPCSQEPSTGHYPEQDQSSPFHLSLSL